MHVFNFQVLKLAVTMAKDVFQTGDLLCAAASAALREAEPSWLAGSALSGEHTAVGFFCTRGSTST